MSQRTIRLDLAGGPLVADIYQPATPTAALPVLLIHGWGGSGRYWRPTIERLQSRFPLIVPDLPGVGRALPVQRAFDMLDLTAALEALLDSLGLARVAVVGHSMGSGLALLLAARQPARVERLVLTSLSLFRDERERRLFGTIMRMAAFTLRLRGRWMARVPALAWLSARRVFYRVPRDTALIDATFRDYLEMDYATALASVRSAGSRAVMDAAAQVRAPTLLVVTHEDRMMPQANVPHTAATIGNCQVCWIAESGHLPMLEQPDTYAAVVAAFLGAPPIEPDAAPVRARASAPVHS